MSTLHVPIKAKLQDGSRVTIVDEDGNIDAPITTTDLTTTGNTTLGNSTSDVLVVSGPAIIRSLLVKNQGAVAAKTTSSTLSASNLLAGIITVNQGAGATSAQQLPLASAMDTALPQFAANDSFEFSVINTSTVDAEDASVTTNTGWTLFGNMDIPAYSAAGSLNSSALFRVVKNGTADWSIYRIG